LKSPEKLIKVKIFIACKRKAFGDFRFRRKGGREAQFRLIAFGSRMLNDRSSGGSVEMCEDMTLTVRERTTECCGVTSKVSFDRIIGLLFKWLPRHGSRFPDGD
jgi:hypothetical protein